MKRSWSRRSKRNATDSKGALDTLHVLAFKNSRKAVALRTQLAILNAARATTDGYNIRRGQIYFIFILYKILAPLIVISME